MTLTLNAELQFFSPDTLAYNDESSDQVQLPRNQQFRKYSRKSYFDHKSPCCDLHLDLEDSTHKKICMTLWLIMLHHHTKFGNKTFRDLENFIQTFTNILNLRCDLDLTYSNPIFPQNTPAYDASLSTQVWLQIDQQFTRYKRNSHILIVYALTVTLTLNTVNQFFCKTLWLMMLYYQTRFGCKLTSSLEDTYLEKIIF